MQPEDASSTLDLPIRSKPRVKGEVDVRSNPSPGEASVFVRTAHFPYKSDIKTTTTTPLADSDGDPVLSLPPALSFGLSF